MSDFDDYETKFEVRLLSDSPKLGLQTGDLLLVFPDIKPRDTDIVLFKYLNGEQSLARFWQLKHKHFRVPIVGVALGKVPSSGGYTVWFH